MKIARILILTTILGGPPALAQESEATKQVERVQEAERTQKAREQKQDQKAERTKKAQEQKPDREAERMKALREQRRADRPERTITGSRVPAQGVPGGRAADVRKGAQGEAQRSEQARRARAGEQRRQVNEFTRLVRDHRVRMAKIGRLAEVFESQGDTAKAERVRVLRQREQENFGRIIARSRKQLGGEHFKSVAKRLKLDD